ncbi:MAG TPA: ribonuclease HI [Crocinitomicaceae bacterium]|nr:ribonuclease HI [Flavobacteriales bacterium]HBW85513.1 ribonuclease HI [Crocinitomicaceae bacterium]
MSNVNIYTDGSSRGNPGPGGYGVILEFQGKRKELSQGFRRTTNNRMELLAVIVGLEHLTTNKYLVCIQSDSKYVIDSITKGWVFDWQKKNFKGKKNEDLWRRYLAIHAKFKLQFTWLKGHAGHPENERCDELAVSAALSNELLVDENFESQEE